MKIKLPLLLLGFISLLFIQCTVQTSDSSSIKTIIVGPETKECVAGVMKKQCLTVKEKAGDNWTMFYDTISGFNYEPGYEYVLTVNVQKIENPPADASSNQYTLIKQISKVKRTMY